MNLVKCLTAALILISLATACTDDPKKSVPNVDHIEVAPEFRRFDQALFTLDTTRIETELAKLDTLFPEFAPLFFNAIMGANDPRVAPEGAAAYIRGFLSHPPARQLYDTVQTVYPELQDLEAQFTDAFRRLKYHFPEAPTPSVTTFLSEYSIAALIYGENDLAVGLDFFLGEDYPYRQYNPGNSNFSDYLTRSFNREHLVAKALVPLVQELIGQPAGSRLLDIMVHNGKERFVLEQLLPFATDTVLFEYPQEDMIWLRDNELQAWAFLLQQDLLYSTDYREFQKLVQPSPVGISGMPPEAPGRVANWLGYRIVSAYMARNPEKRLPDLIAERDAQRILDLSRYKPAHQ